MIALLDESVGVVVETLRRLRLEQNTLLIFCSDNGADAPNGVPANGGLKGKKGSMQEGGHRVPFIASWPGVIAPGQTSGAAVMTMDFLPTVAKLAGATVPRDHVVDGMDLMPLLKSEARAIDRDLHWLFGDAWAVRQGPWKLTGRGDAALSLVNLEDDLGEITNLLEKQPSWVERLLALHRTWIGSVGRR
jgi:arylsulfatase A-like enzyme